MTGRLIQLSGVIVDHVYRVAEVPRPGEEALVREAHLEAGGGFNAMVAARRSGMDVAYGGSLGTGPFAEIAAAALAREDIALLRPRLPGLDQGCCTVLVDDAGERTFVALEGADGVVTADDLASLRTGPDDWLLLSGYALHYRGSRAALTGWLRDARPPRLVFDPAPIVAHLGCDALDAALDTALWVSANAAEAATATGAADPADAARRLSARLPAEGGAIVRVGAGGCHLSQGGRPAQHLPAHPVTAVDTTGAGDAHIGAFVAALARGETPEGAARAANVAAALSIAEHGPATAPTLERIAAELARAEPLVQTRR